jgi:DNA-binding CsgD family transcriptional regulator
MAQALIGRRAELVSAERFLDSLSSGPAAFVVAGEAGIGKTTVAEAVADLATANGFAVLSARGSEVEADLGLSGLSELLSGVPGELLGRLPGAQRRAIDAAFLRTSGDDDGPADPRALGMAVWTIVTELARSAAVLITVDDLQWLDGASRHVLEFALRRVRHEPVGLLATWRAGDGGVEPPGLGIDPSRTEVIRLGGLSLAGLRTLVSDRLGVSLSRASLTKLEHLSGANPLLALEIVRYLQRRDREVRVEELIPVPADIARLVEDRLAALTPEAADLLLLAALGRIDLDELRDAMPGVDLERPIAAAVDQGLIRLEHRSLRFEHPLYASAIVGRAAPATRRALHRVLGAAIRDPIEAARHRAVATEVPDESIAADLEAAARRAAAGSPDAAIGLLEHAIRLTPDRLPEIRARRTLVLAQHLWDAGDVSRSAVLATEAEAMLAPGSARATARLLRAAQALWIEGPAGAIDLCWLAIGDAAGDPMLEARAHLRIAYAADEDLAAAARHVEAALAALGTLEGAQNPQAVELLAAALLFGVEIALRAGVRPDGEALRRGRALLATIPERTVPTLAFHGRGIARERDFLIRQSLDDLAGARQVLLDTVDETKALGMDRAAVIQLADLAELESWLGHAGPAAAAAAASEELADTVGSTVYSIAMARFAASVVGLHVGDLQAASDAVEAGLVLADEGGHAVTADRLRAVRGSLALAARRTSDATADFDAVERALDAAGLRHPSTYRFRGDAIEALVLAGRREAAAEAVARLEADGADLDSPWTAVIVPRSRGLLAAMDGDLAAALASVDEALDLHDRLAMPVELGRTWLLKGQLHRRRKEKSLADEALRRALETFELAGANGWSERARTELRRVGLRPRAAETLTDTEAEVARLAATGLTNRQVADAVVLSPRTIDGILGRVYRKLGIGSRAELGARMSAPGGPADRSR